MRDEILAWAVVVGSGAIFGLTVFLRRLFPDRERDDRIPGDW